VNFGAGHIFPVRKTVGLYVRAVRGEPEQIRSELFHGPEMGNGSLLQLYSDVSDPDTASVGD
jgi:hypothetical protein